MKKHIYFVLFSIIVLFLDACQQQKTDWRGTSEEVEGVMVIKNPKIPMHSDDIFIIEQDLSIGAKEGPEEYMFSSLSSLAVDEDGNLYVFDSRQAKIKVFDQDGIFVREFGKMGQGPGEFLFPWGIAISPEQKLIVCDFMARRLKYFSLDGKYQEDKPTWREGGLLDMRVDSKGNFVGQVYTSEENAVYSLKKFNPNFEPLITLKSIERDKIPILESLAPKLIWCISDLDEIIWGFSKTYEIYIHNPEGILLRKIIKDFNPIQIVKEDYSQEVKNKFGGRPIPPEFEQELPNNYPAIRSISVDNDGRLFVGTFEKVDPGEGYYCDIFDSEGKYLSKALLKSFPRVWKGGKFYAIENDVYGYQYVKRYNVTWNY